MPARRLPWFKLWPEAMRHEKVVLLSDGAFRAWIMTLAAGAEQTTRWRFGSVQHLLRVTGRAEAEVHELISVHLLDVAGNGEVWIHDWRQWQERFASDFTPRTHRNGSANSAPKLPPDVRRETGELRRETEDTSTPLPPPPQAEEGAIAPATKGDVKLWTAARERLRVSMSASNWDQLIAPLEPLGRALDGGLRLRAPPGYPAATPLAHLRTALEDEGEAMAPLAAIIGA
jgi:hypothetical protein